MNTPQPTPKPFRYSLPIRLSGWALVILLGPGLLVFVGVEVQRRSGFSESVTASVVEVRQDQSGSHQAIYCPTYAWEHGGRTVQTEGPCDSDEVAVGQEVPIRYPAEDPGSARPETFGAMYGELIPGVVVGGLFSVLFLFVAIRRLRSA